MRGLEGKLDGLRLRGIHRRAVQTCLRVWESGAAYRIRTYDPIITNDVLYQLS